MTAVSFAIAAAHNITPRTVATWYPSLVRSPRVLVPIQLDVMMIRDDGEIAANCLMAAPDPSATDVKRLDLLPPPFAELTAPRPRGAYLHWALPDALTHGTSDSQNAQFYAVPDRWLILRLFPGSSIRGAPRRAVRGWVLRSGDAVPTVTDLAQWVETGPSTDGLKGPLTAMGHGDPAWAAYYENVINRLGFFDSLSDVKSGPIAYLVCGWYADQTFDPLGDPNIKSLNDFNAVLGSLNWSIDPTEWQESVKKTINYVQAANSVGLATAEFAGLLPAAQASAPAARATATARVSAAQSVILGSVAATLDSTGRPVGGAYTTDGSWWPTATIYHGAVVGIGWPGIGWPGNPSGLLGDPGSDGVTSGEFGGPPPAQEISVTVGNTITEALASLVAAANKAPDEARVLEAFLLGSLAELDKPDGPAKTDDMLHSASFATRDGGFVTEEIQVPARPATPAPPPAPVAPQPGVFATHLASGFQHLGAGLTTSILSNEVGTANARTFQAAEFLTGVTIFKGGLASALGAVQNPVLAPPEPAQTLEVKRALPRYFQPADPVFLIQGGARSFKHGADGRFSQDGSLICRLTGFCVTELSCAAVSIAGEVQVQPARASVSGDDLLESGVENGSVPLECEDLLRELVLLDPGSASSAASASTTLVGTNLAAQAQNFMVEQTAIYATRDPRFDAGPLVARSGITGTIASPIAFNLPVRPWNPIHLDWKVEFDPTPGPTRDPAAGATDWALDEIDFLGIGNPPPSGAPNSVTLSGRAHLTGGAAQAAAQGIRTALQQATTVAGTNPLPPNIVERFHSGLSQILLAQLDLLSATYTTPQNGGTVPSIDRSVLTDIASALENIDVLTGALDNFNTRLRGGLTGDGVTVPQPPGSPPPASFFAFRAGYLRVLRLRLVDGFGQFVDLAGSSDTTTADPGQIITSGPTQVPQAPGIVALPPRFTSPARLWFRFVDATDDTTDASATISPVCGFLLPDHLDGDLEIFDVDGSGLGALRPDAQTGVAWDNAPGRPSTVGPSPALAIPNPHAAGIAQALLLWGTADAQVPGAREDALSAFLRITDSTLWSVDPFGHSGDEHLSLLIGHPVAVMRARLFVEVAEPVDPGAVNTRSIPIRLGSLAHWQDGLFGFFVNDDYNTLYCADGAAAYAREVGPNRGFLQQINLVPDYYAQFAQDLGAGVTEGNAPVNHPYVDSSGLLWIVPNQTYMLTLLVEPHNSVHATSGLLPRKEIGMRRDWVAAALAQLAPTFRFGPVLVDPKRIRMPIPRDIAGTWSWDYRADVATWSEDPVTNITGDALLSPDPAQGTEGWLKLGPPPASNGGASAS
jgi:hypothetical protein